MPPETVIAVESLGKCFTIRHQAGGGRLPRYRRFSEELSHAAMAPFRGLKIPWRRRDPSPEMCDRAPAQEQFWALKDVSFDVRRGEVVGIIGRNGAGKSTLLKLLSRITEPSEGRIRLRGRVASLLEVGTGFHPELTGRENIYLNGTVLGMTRREIRGKFDEIVAFAEVEKFLDTPVKRYSSGMYVRLAFSVAAHLEPEILLVDEVLAVGDMQFQKKCLGKMEDVAGGGRTVLFVSHNMPVIQAVAGRCIVLHDGRVACDAGTPAAIDLYYRECAAGWKTRMPGAGPPDRPRFLDVWFEDTAGQRIPQPRTSDTLVVCATWHNPKPAPGLRVGFGLNDAAGSRIFGSVPEDSGGAAPSAAGAVTARFTIPPNTLLPKRYSIDLRLWVPNAENYHSLQPAVTFDALPGASPILAVDHLRDGQIQFHTTWAFQSAGSERP